MMSSKSLLLTVDVIHLFLIIEPVDTGPKRLKIVPFQDVFEKLKENILIKEPRNFILIQSNMSLDVSTKVKYQLVVKTL
ncbi:hypothetical protein GLOIN_2v260979 [Rhizophagus irregularis DAOM 181602=DAOM 197198]|uniref:Uncharacterized protein n=1 Tax=Rhizophagus irregularis (strain DAOM 181602 / DAOM 197198 / MUCL 43194) TaxID=747089 RepID=A0A2P4PRL8_RHIID|nr:hypothetical protein GLOIN_2v260979 [Rhizophagus irregularis DAOM 181602=DAOM 197198]POG68022.1 hypothetical protein GLOIN_2v260979 [Rhizophagus irregularis DAOM 181602=DAOM 197198]|eukprot:XP_025174888.1 hypothetical protein GLOIN_2v260979 [Rhizophagus irregularis DAOM 181602=DAOM 197198]